MALQFNQKKKVLTKEQLVEFEAKQKEAREKAKKDDKPPEGGELNQTPERRKGGGEGDFGGKGGDYDYYDYGGYGYSEGEDLEEEAADFASDEVDFNSLTVEEKYKAYETNVREISTYLEISGMFETKFGQDYGIFNAINEDPFTWKQYPIEDNIQLNDHNMLELKFNLSDTTLLGSGSSVTSMLEVINRYQLTFNDYKIKWKAYTQCKLNSVCANVVSETDTAILNFMYTDAYAVASDTAMTAEQWEAAHTAAEALTETAKNTSSQDWFKVVDDYYIVKLEKRVEENAVKTDQLYH